MIAPLPCRPSCTQLALLTKREQDIQNSFTNDAQSQRGIAMKYWKKSISIVFVCLLIAGIWDTRQFPNYTWLEILALASGIFSGLILCWWQNKELHRSRGQVARSRTRTLLYHIVIPISFLLLVFSVPILMRPYQRDVQSLYILFSSAIGIVIMIYFSFKREK